MSETLSFDIEAVFEELGKIGEDESGLQRLAFSDYDNQGFDFIKSILQKEQISYREDAFGNLIGRIPGTDDSAPAIATGSHIDSVPDGGKYDGPVGVVAGLHALVALKEKKLKHPVELIAFRAEESSRFGHSCMGSKLMNGYANLEKWAESPDAQGKTVFDALKESGFDPDNLDQVRIDPKDYKAFIECHIEQGRVLEDAKISVGVVSAIAAPTRFLIEIDGTADHSGATPMGLRHDALVAASQVVTMVNNIATREAKYGTVGTVGRMDVSPNAMNVIPGKVVMSVDIRGVNEDSIRRTTREMLEFASSLEGVAVFITRLSEEKPVQLSRDIAGVLSDACREAGVSTMPLQSGAGHDAMYMAKEIPTAMLFVPSVDGVSHNQKEFTPFQDIRNVAQVLARAIETLAS